MSSSAVGEPESDRVEDQVDDRLMERYSDGDAAAFQELYGRWERPLFGFLLRMLPDREGAADAFQEVWSRVVDARRDYRPRGRFRSWLFTIARRICVDRARSFRREEEGEAEYAVERRVRGGGGPSPDTELAREEELHRLLDRLPRGQREALLLGKYYGFTYGEIAEMIGSTEAAVKQKVYRALRTLRDERRNPE